jgi:hypothetical protein
MRGGFISENNSSTICATPRDAIGVVHASDVDALRDRSDLVAKVGEESLPLDARDVDDIDPAFNPARKTGQRLRGIARHLTPAPDPARLLRQTFPIV